MQPRTFNKQLQLLSDTTETVLDYTNQNRESRITRQNDKTNSHNATDPPVTGPTRRVSRICPTHDKPQGPKEISQKGDLVTYVRTYDFTHVRVETVTCLVPSLET